MKQKNENLISIIADVQVARQSYPELKETGVFKNKTINSIIDALKSDILEEFFQYYSIKSHYNKSYLKNFSYSITDLVRTEWFKARIEEIITS